MYFLSRPRRFGKSLTVSTFDALFSGKKELFKGLYAEEFFERPEYRTYPVIRFDMSKTVTYKGMEEFCMSIFLQINDNAERNEISVSEVMGNPSMGLHELLKNTFKKHGPVTVLIDEYDKPIFDCLHDREKAEILRSALRSFYSQIKAGDATIKFVFITGITKFTKTGVFSAMNNLYDISMDQAYATMLGYTDDELESYFDGHMEEAGKRERLIYVDMDKVMLEMKNVHIKALLFSMS